MNNIVRRDQEEDWMRLYREFLRDGQPATITMGGHTYMVVNPNDYYHTYFVRQGEEDHDRTSLG